MNTRIWYWAKELTCNSSWLVLSWETFKWETQQMINEWIRKDMLFSKRSYAIWTSRWSGGMSNIGPFRDAHGPICGAFGMWLERRVLRLASRSWVFQFLPSLLSCRYYDITFPIFTSSHWKHTNRECMSVPKTHIYLCRIKFIMYNATKTINVFSTLRNTCPSETLFVPFRLVC
jgi:hypothetical protein